MFCSGFVNELEVWSVAINAMTKIRSLPNPHSMRRRKIFVVRLELKIKVCLFNAKFSKGDFETV